MLTTRSSGILMHISSLPGKYGIGDFGKSAFQFINFLSESGTKYWQILPLGHTGYGDSPYQTFSAFAGNPLFIDIEELLKDNLINSDIIDDYKVSFSQKIDYDAVTNFKNLVLREAFKNFVPPKDYYDFVEKNSFWLDNYALFMALKRYHNGKPWWDWHSEYKFVEQNSIENFKKENMSEINYQKFLQYQFFKQWQTLLEYANIHQINIIGDIPIFVSYDSADVWSNPELFLMDENKNLTKVAGVPPDYFSETGQLWGNPLYNWDAHLENDFQWWINRFQLALQNYSLIRIDHFRGFEACWAVPYGELTAINGEWLSSPGEAFFEIVQKQIGCLPFIAEDLGIITPEVERLRDKYNLPGMKILQFAFGSNWDNPYLPHNVTENSVLYTGTHDNDTTFGWYNKLGETERQFVDKYLKTDGKFIVDDLISCALDSKSNLVIIPMQDWLGLDSDTRMNTPGKTFGNWSWRIEKNIDFVSLSRRIQSFLSSSGRLIKN